MKTFIYLFIGVLLVGFAFAYSPKVGGLLLVVIAVGALITANRNKLLGAGA
jgi:hypothetical protein